MFVGVQWLYIYMVQKDPNETQTNLYKIKDMNNLCMILLFTFASTSNVFTCFASQYPESHWKVTILNYQDVPLLTYCKSENDDLGK